ncbi:MAG: tetratricopeptide repeat protein [Fermentimonas sp.]|nr:tetratricopeptide repeat protein [Fermentimonas sp.]
MDENDIDITSLVEKYENMRALGKKVYFDADEFALLADFYYSEGDTSEAELLVEEGLAMHPGSSELMTLKAKQLVLSGKYKEALSFMRHLSNDNDLDLPLLKIEAFLHLSRFDEAEKLTNKILNKDLPEEDYYYFINEVGYLLNDVDKFDRAIAYLEEGLKINNSNPEVLIDLAYSYEMKGDMDKAIEYNNRLLDINPYSFDAWVNIGKLFTMNEQYDKAIDSFDFALTIREDELSVLKMKAMAHYLNDNVDESIAIFRKCLAMSPEEDAIYDSLLEAYAAMEQYEEMMNLIDLREERIGSEGIFARRAFVYLSKGDFDLAKSYFFQIPEDEKETLEYHMLEGELAFHDENFAAAEAAYIKAALISEGNEEILDKLANISVAQEKYKQAADYLEELLKLSPEYSTAKARLAFVRFEIGSKEPFDNIMQQFTDEELRDLLSLIMGSDKTEFADYSREKILTRLNEARENRVLFKNIKY